MIDERWREKNAFENERKIINRTDSHHLKSRSVLILILRGFKNGWKILLKVNPAKVKKTKTELEKFRQKSKKHNPRLWQCVAKQLFFESKIEMQCCQKCLFLSTCMHLTLSLFFLIDKIKCKNSNWTRSWFLLWTFLAKKIMWNNSPCRKLDVPFPFWNC